MKKTKSLRDILKNKNKDSINKIKLSNYLVLPNHISMPNHFFLNLI